MYLSRDMQSYPTSKIHQYAPFLKSVLLSRVLFLQQKDYSHSLPNLVSENTFPLSSRNTVSFPLTCFFHSSIDCFLVMCNKQLITTESCHFMIPYYITVFPFPSAHLNFLINLGLCQRKVIYLIFLLSNCCLTEESTLLSLTNSISHEVCVAINYGSTSRSLWKLQLCLENHDCFIYPERGSLHGV